MQLQKTSPWVIGFVQAAAIVAYIVVFCLFVQTAQNVIGIPLNNPILGMCLILTAFVFSALVCGGVALGYPLVLLADKKTTMRAVWVVGWTGFWLAVFIVVFVGAGLRLSQAGTTGY